MPGVIPLRTTMRAILSRNLKKIGLLGFSQRSDPFAEARANPQRKGAMIIGLGARELAESFAVDLRVADRLLGIGLAKYWLALAKV